MLERLIGEIFSEVVRESPRPEEKFQIEIPVDHPKAEQLLRLAAELASHQQLPCGVTVTKLYKPGSADKFLDALSEFGVDVNEIRSKLDAKAHLELNTDNVPAAIEKLRTILPSVERP